MDKEKKKQNKTEVINYRLISKINKISKILGKNMYNFIFNKIKPSATEER